MADDAFVWLTQVCPWQATVWQRVLASQNVTVQWQSEGSWHPAWNHPPHLWLLDVAIAADDITTYCQWWREHWAHVPLGLIDSRQKHISEA
ncbi:MAG: hypothetical protein Q6K90_07095, partial [Gloeomargarita sp. HHBFW_bins_162]